MTSDVAVKAIGFDHHRHGIPAHVTLDPPLDFPVARIRRLLFRGDRIQVGGTDGIGDLNAGSTEPVDQLVQQK